MSDPLSYLRRQVDHARQMGDRYLWIDTAQIHALLTELDEARQRCEGLAERVAAQSELLTRRAGRSQ